MATLTGKTIASTYKDLLQISNSNSGVDSTLRVVSDGEATDTVLYLSSAAAQITSDAKLYFRDTGLYIASNADGDLDIVSDGTAIDSINIDTFEPLVTIKDFQLTTQIDKSMKTTPDKKYEELS